METAAVAPKFTTHIKEISTLVEGQSAHFEAYLTPTNDPNLKVEWYFNGKLLGAGECSIFLKINEKLLGDNDFTDKCSIFTAIYFGINANIVNLDS